MNCVMKYPGAKWRAAPWIASHFPAHTVYLEPFFGSGAVFFAKEPAPFETVNDLDKNVFNFFKVAREHPQELARLVTLTPYSRTEFESVEEPTAGAELQLTDDPIENARRFLVRCSQGFGSKLADRVGWWNTKSSAGPIQPNVWSGLPESIIQAAERLKHAQIECRPALDLIRAYNAPDCLIYADPPYPFATRRGRIYRHEMGGEKEHEELLKVLLQHKGMVVLSGYDNDLYNDTLQGWCKDTARAMANHAKPRTETIWMNFQNEEQMKMF